MRNTITCSTATLVLLAASLPAAPALAQAGGMAQQPADERWRRTVNVEPTAFGQLDEFTYQRTKADLVFRDNPNAARQPDVGLIQDWPAPIDKRDFRAIDPTAEFDPEHIYVAFKPGTPQANMLGAHAALGTALKWTSSLTPMTYQVNLQGKDVIATVNQYLDMPDVLYAEPCYLAQTTADTDDPYWIGTGPTGWLRCYCEPWLAEPRCLWNLKHNDDFFGGIRASTAWDETTGDPNFVIAVIDTGAAVTHPDLAANIWVNPSPSPDPPYLGTDINGWNVFENTGDVSLCGTTMQAAHGSHVSGTVGAVGNNGEGIVGVNWQCQLMIVRCAADYTDPSDGMFYPCASFLFDVVAGLDYAVSRGAKVSNNSYGYYTFSQANYDSILAAQAFGHIVVAAAGNGRDPATLDNIGDDNDGAWPMYPASYDLSNIIAVAAITVGGHRPEFSNYGASTVDIAAPGANILSTGPAETNPLNEPGVLHDYFRNNGTSMAAPHVAGAIGLVWSRNPTQQWWQIKQRICEGTPLRTFQTSCGAPLTSYGAWCDPDYGTPSPCDNEYPGEDFEHRLSAYTPFHVPCVFSAQLDVFKAMGYWIGNSVSDPTRPGGSYLNPISTAGFNGALPLLGNFGTLNFQPGTTVSVGARLDTPMALRAPDGGTVRLVP